MQKNYGFRSDSNQGFHAPQSTSMVGALSMFSTHKMRCEQFVCKYISYFQSLIYFRTKLLTCAKFSHHVWTGFCNPTGDGKRSSQKFVNIVIRNSKDFKCIRFPRTSGVVEWCDGRFMLTKSVVRILVVPLCRYSYTHVLP